MSDRLRFVRRHRRRSNLELLAALLAFGCGSKEAAQQPTAPTPPPGPGPGCEIEAASNGGASSGEAGASSVPASFRWKSSGPLLKAIPDKTHPILSVKDPTVVRYQDRFHVFATTADTSNQWSLVYTSFESFCDAPKAQLYYLDQNPNLRGYHAAPQVFFFRPHNKWYMIFQSGQPQYTTTDDISNPESWVAPTNFFAAEPPTVTANKGIGGWLDFWIICDSQNCHLFFTDDNGILYRSQTTIADFPGGFGDASIAIRGTKETLFEGSMHYAIAGTGQYLTLVEAFGTSGRRLYRSFVSDTLDGEWTPLAATPENPFAGSANVSFHDGVAEWTRDFSHGELIRDGFDETLTVSLDDLHFLYQGVDPQQGIRLEYYELPWQLGLLTLDDASP